MSSETASFTIGLHKLISVRAPALHSLTCLEANEATAGEAFIYWHAFLQTTLHALRDEENEIPEEVQEELIGILNC